MLNRFFKWAVPKLESWCERTGRVMNITGKQGPDDVYLIRYFLFRSKYVSVYIHRFLRSDIDDPHDHPFDFIGYVVSGQYDEQLFDKHYRSWHPLRWLLMEKEGVRGEGTWAYRPAETIHKVVVDRNRTVAEKGNAPLTFIIRGPVRREWNFWRLEAGGSNSGGFVFGTSEVWYDYLGIPSESRE